MPRIVAWDFLYFFPSQIPMGKLILALALRVHQLGKNASNFFTQISRLECDSCVREVSSESSVMNKNVSQNILLLELDKH